MVRQPERRHVWPLTPSRTAALVALALAATSAATAGAQAASPVPLATAGSFAVLGGSTITNVGPSTITGDIGLCCSGVSPTGFASIIQPRGAVYLGTGGVAATAQDDLDVAYANAAARAVTATLVPDLSLSGTPATPLLPGVYQSTGHGAFQINTGLTLDFLGDPNAVFIFQATDLTTAAAAAGSVRIVNGGSAPSTCNIFWQLSDDTQGVTLGAASAFKGTTMSLGASALGTGATVEGRILTRRSKQVTLLANTITQTQCATQTVSGTGAGGGGSGGSTPTPVPTPTPTPTPTSVPDVVASVPGTSLPGASGAPAVVVKSPSGSVQLSGPSGPVSGPFVVSVTGQGIDTVTFSVDGHRVSTVHAKPGRTKFKLKINPRHKGPRVHRVTARVTFDTPGRSTTTLHMIYRRPPASPRPPQFTG